MSLPPLRQCAAYLRNPLSLLRLFLFGLLTLSAPASAVDLLISNFTDSPDPAVRGGKLAYTASITNNATDTATNVKLVIALHAQLVFNAVSDTARCKYVSEQHQVECAYPTVRGELSGAAADVFTATVTVTSKASAGNTVSAIATVNGDGPDTNTANNTASQISTIDNGADLALALSGAPDPVLAGGTLTYTATATNLGPNPAGSTNVTLTLSPNLTYSSYTGAGWTCSVAAKVVTCNRGASAVGALPPINISSKVTGAQSGTLTSAATVSITGSATDYQSNNDTTTVNTTVNPGADLTITKTANLSKQASGAAVEFKLSPRNAGPFAASNVLVRDILPAGFTNITASGSGWTCPVSGQTVECRRSSYAVNASNDIVIKANVPTVGALTTFTNTATIQSDTPDPINNNSGSDTIDVMPPGADLSIEKTKAPNPVAQGEKMVSTIRVKNNGPRSAVSGEVSVIETLPAGEAYFGLGADVVNWTCVPAGQVITCTYNASLGVDRTTAPLTITTTATVAGALNNTACAVYTDKSPVKDKDLVSGNDCATAGATVTPSATSVDLSISKTVDTDPLTWNDDTLVYTVTVTNLAPSSATGVVMTDVIPGYRASTNNLPSTGVKTTKSGTTAATFDCIDGQTVTCTQTSGAIAQNETAVFNIEVKRPLNDNNGASYTNRATVTSTDFGDSNPSNNAATVTVKVQPLVDLHAHVAAQPSAARAGTNVTHVLTVNNFGPSTATGITLSHKLEVTAGDLTFVSATPNGNGGGSCSWNGAASTVDCTLPDMAGNSARTVTVIARADYLSNPPIGRALTGSMNVKTESNEIRKDNNDATASSTVTQATLDLLINNTDSPDPLSFVPANANPSFPDNVVTYRNVITNRGPSVASNLVMTYTMTPPAGKEITFLGDKPEATGQVYSNYCNNLNAKATSSAPLTLTCTFPASVILLANNATKEIYLDFRVDTNPSQGGDTFASIVSIKSSEPDSDLTNNSISQNTTVKMRSDLQLAKSARAFVGNADADVSAVQLRQPFYWVLTLKNAGPGDSQQTVITDTLPSGISMYTPPADATAPYSAAPYSQGVRWATDNATPTNGTCTGTSTLSCSIGVLESGKTAILRIPVVATSTGAKNNCAFATTASIDPDLDNNRDKCSSVDVQASSLAGAVYADQDANGSRGAAEPGIEGVALLLEGKDAYGNAVARNVTSAADGSFSIGELSPGTYKLTETHPAAWLDGVDVAGSAGGTPGAVGTDAIEAIALPGNTAATGYLFGEVGKTSLSGYVFVDNNGNALRDGSENTGIAGVTMTLTGTDVAGAVNKTVQTGASGLYTFADLRPGTYQVEQAVIAGVTHTGMTVGSKGGNDGAAAVAANTAVPGATKRSIGSIVLAGGDMATNYNFGESGQGLSGFVYVDRNGNGTKDTDEAGIAGVAMTLSGNTAGGVNVCAAISPNPCTVQTGATGAYGFSGVPASDATGYRISQQSQATAPLSNYADGQERAGSLGGSTATNDVISGIVVRLGDSGANYDFGERSGAIAGRIYLDANDNGALDAGETGIAGVTLTLSGRTASGVDVCSILASCTLASGADGSFAFIGLPAADGDGYVLTEAQPVDYAERSNAAGAAGGAIGLAGANTTLSAIRLGAGVAADGYLFGEKPGVLAGHAYLDANNNGLRDAGETGIAGVGFTLSGTTASGVDVCTRATCTAVSGADGGYRFTGLPNAGVGGYTVTQQAQNVAPLASYLDGKVTPGSNCGACSVGAGAPNTIGVVRVDAASAFTGYDFGELRPASLAGSVYLDANLNGARDGGEGLAAVSLTLSGNDDLGGAVTRTVTTGADGAYRFEGLRPSGAAGYTVTETQPAAYGDFTGATGTAAGSAGGTVSLNTVTGVVLATGVDATGYDFRETSASLAGRVYMDSNGNGVPDAGEGPLAGVTMTLEGQDVLGATVRRVVQTAADGSYRFSGLPAGVYAVTETHPGGVLDGRERAGSSGGTVNNSSFDETPARNAITAITLAAGADATGYDFGEQELPPPADASLSGRVYQDLNGNGRADPDEPGIPGVTVQLSGSDSLGAPIRIQAVTGANGRYAFTGLSASSAAGYRLDEVQPNGYGDGQNSIAVGLPGSAVSAKPVAPGALDSIDGIVVNEGMVLSGYDFGERQPVGAVAGKVYLDRDDNGVQDAGEPGISGVTLVLSGSDKAGKSVRREATSGADGDFRFADLPESGAGGYQLAETQPAGYRDGKTTIASGQPGAPGAKPVAQGAADTVGGIVLAGGQELDGYRFGETPLLGSLGGVVYFDPNNDGVQGAGETGIAGVTLVLSGNDKEGKPVRKETTSSADGSFRFADLPASGPAGYLLTELQPTAYLDGKTVLAAGLPGTPGVKPIGPDGRDTVAGIVLAAGDHLTGYRFAELPLTGSLGGVVYLDRNDDGVQGAGETGIPGVTLVLSGTDKDGKALRRETTTGADGSFRFADLPPSGTAGYLLTELQPAAYADGKTVLATGLPGTPGAKPLGSDGRDTVAGVVLAAGRELTGYRFGELPLMGSIGGLVWLDRDNDGLQGTGESGIAGVTLVLSGSDKAGTAVRRETTSGADGSFRFADLPESSPTGYLLAELQPAAYLDGKTVLVAGMPGTPGAKPLGTDGRDTVAGIVLAAGQHLGGYRFGEQPMPDKPGSLAGLVWLDRDDDGAQGPGETGIAGVTLVLSGNDKEGKPVRKETTSGADGSFRFADLPASSPAGYLLTELQPAAYLDGKTVLAAGLPGTSGAKPIGPDGRDTVAGIVLAAGDNLAGYRFAELPLTGSLGGVVYLDRNDDGAQGTGETGIAGVALVLSGLDKDGNAVRRDAVTGADGSFRFTGLPPSGQGGYLLAETQPAGYLDGKTVLAAGLPGTPGAKPIGADGRDTVSSIVLAGGQHLDGYRFGERPLTGSLGGVVFLDRNDDGMQTGGETGIAGVALVLSGVDKDGNAVRRETTSGADGSFRFADLPPSGTAGYLLAELQPASYADGKTVLAPGLPGTPGAKPLGSDGRDTVGAIVLAAGQHLDGYRFGELARSRVAGSVYFDRDGNGLRDAGDTGMAGVTMLLGGRQLDGTLFERSVQTGADGGFAFDDVPSSDAAGYRLAEVQPGGVTDGRTTVPSGLPGSAAGAKPVGVGNHDLVNGIRVGPGAVLEGYLFGETAIPSLKPPIVNGYVWLDRGHSRVRPVDGSMQGLGGWTVQLMQNDKLICQVLTNAEGFYQFDNLHCPGYEVSGLPTGSGFSIAFSREGSTLPAVAQSGGNRGKAAASGGRISDISLSLGDQVIEQNLPLDPAGIVYDLRTRKPVAGATVVVQGPAGFVPARHLVGAEAAATQVTGVDGMYQFLLQGDFPSGVYTLAVSSPAGYLPGPSAELKACAGAANVTLVPTPALVQKSDPPPAASVPLHKADSCAGIVAGGADSTQYYLALRMTNGGSAPILNNHIPLDPVATGGVVLTKTTPRVNVSRGELVPYTITAANGSQGALPGVVLRDRMPPGFKYRPGSARIDGVPSEPKVEGRLLSWPVRTLAPRSQTSITLVLAVGAGVGEGEYVNQADAVNALGAPVSNVATAAVRIVPDATFDCPDVIGKVFDDANANGYQDEGEAGLPAVRLATPRGLLVTTDAQGRFHVPCAELPNPDRGTNFVMKLDERTLPSGYRVTTNNPGDVRVTRGKVAKLNFGATVHRVVRVELSDAAYEGDGRDDVLAAPWKQQIDTMMEQLKKKPSVLRIAYQRGAAGEEAAKRRAAALVKDVQARWKEQGDLYPLAIEVEDVR